MGAWRSNRIISLGLGLSVCCAAPSKAGPQCRLRAPGASTIIIDNNQSKFIGTKRHFPKSRESVYARFSAGINHHCSVELKTIYTSRGAITLTQRPGNQLGGMNSLLKCDEAAAPPLCVLPSSKREKTGEP